MPVATTFVHEHEGKSLLGGVARLDTLVTMVDAFNFLKDTPGLVAKRGFLQDFFHPPNCCGLKLVFLNQLNGPSL